jgi:enoyl-CoA hydratase/carnithine racemase
VSYQTLLVEVADGVGTLTLNRPEARNALNPTLLGELREALGRLEADPETRVVVLRGAGERAFCAGADLKGMFGAASILEAREQYAGVATVLEAIPRMRTPVIAQVHGFALAGGCGLAAACDLVIAAEDAVFGLPEIKVGLLPLMVLAPILRAASPKRVLELVLTGRELPAPEALEIGLVTRVVPRRELEEAVRGVARTLAALSPATVALGKEGFYRALELPHAEALAHLRDLLTIVARSEDAREGIAAFLEKRPPRWQGR